VHIPTWVWIVTIGVTLAVLLFDVVVIGRRPHEPSTREVTIALTVYVGLAVVFGVGVSHFSGSAYGTQFFAGWLTEYSLSIDNLFIFLIILQRFAVPRPLQQSALMIGIVLALLMRSVFIAVGAAAINNISWIFYLFGAFLVYTAISLARGHDDTGGDEGDGEEGWVIRWLRRRVPSTDDFHGSSLTVRSGGHRLVTPMLLVVAALGTTDLLFALDSIPAIYGLTQEAYLVLTANIFALMGLRQLYFLIGGLLRRLIYLSYGLAFLLLFIGVKLVLHALHENELPFVNGGNPVGWAPDIPIWLSLLVIVGSLGVTATVSLLVSGSRATQT
jgi:tellurite resistance protein TerC